MEWRSFPFLADKTRERVSRPGKSRAVHKVDAHPSGVACRFCIERMIEYPARRKGECARATTTISRWWRLSVTARAALAYSSLFSSNPSHCANVFLLSRHSRRPTFQSGPFSVRPPAFPWNTRPIDLTNTARQYSHDLIHFGEWLVTFFFFILPLSFFTLALFYISHAQSFRDTIGRFLLWTR